MKSPTETLDDFRDLTENWDSYGALPITETAIAIGHKIIATYPNPWFVAPVPDGGVQVEYRQTSPAYKEVEIQIGPTGDVSYVVEKRIYDEGKLDGVKDAFDLLSRELLGRKP